MCAVVFLLGTNLGNKAENLIAAKEKLSEVVGSFQQASSIFVTPPWGFESTNEFYNQVVIFETELSPFPLLDSVQDIEKALGRKNKTTTAGYTDRIIDIDILFYDRLIFETQRLTIPHPHLHKRRFTLEPLNELIPDFIHPVFNSSVANLLKDCTDKGEVNILS